MDGLRSLYERIVADGVDGINRLIEEQIVESSTFDYKLAESPMRADDRKSLAEALSGFANSDGGIIIWGVNCRKNEEGLDVPKNIEPINGLKRFECSLNDLSSQVVSPGVIGVEHQVIHTGEDKDVGCAVTYVRKSEGEPHMAIASGQHCFFYRSGGSFLRMEAFMVADRYGRRPQPRLEILCEIVNLATLYYKPPVGVRFSLRNTGLGIALYPALVISQVNELAHAFKEYRNNGFTLTRFDDSGGSKTAFMGDVNTVIHPGIAFPVCVYHLRSNYRLEKEIVLEYELYCDGFSLRDRFILTPDVLNAELEKRGIIASG